ncbi:MAG: hypothetical protein KC800_15250 [Candidatus Eremiobacteraeota bacterium]|nr:hypothetical protein [Candidatus Eremiobacteraeota bacterium]
MTLDLRPDLHHLNELKALSPEHLTVDHLSCLKDLFEKGDPFQQAELYELLQGLLDEYFFIEERERSQMLLMLVRLRKENRLDRIHMLRFNEILSNLDLMATPESELIEQLLQHR